MLTPKDVFTPGRPPLGRAEVYAPRGEPERELAMALERGLVPVVFGEFGVGKTSLARHALRSAERARRLVNVESASGKTFADVVRAVLEHLGYEITRSRMTTETAQQTTTRQGEAGLGLVPMLSAKLSGGRATSTTKGETVMRELAVSAPTDSRVLELCDRARLVLLVDELHAATPELLADLSAFVKAATNKPCRHFRVVLVGTAREATRLVRHDPGIDRILVELEVSALSTREARGILEEGMRALAIDAPARALDRAARVASGSPALAQWLGLEMAEAATKRSPRKLAPEDLTAAVQSYVRTKSKRLERAWRTAIETTGKKRYRRQILLALATTDDELVTLDALAARVEKQLGEPTPSSAISAPLRALKSKDYGEIVRDVPGDDLGRVTFRDPSMRAFVRMRDASDREGLMDDEA